MARPGAPAGCLLLAEPGGGGLGPFGLPVPVSDLLAAVCGARRLGMTGTRYTDPSGLAASTVSTAADQVLLGRAVMAQPVLAGIVATRTAVVPVAGPVRNLNPTDPGCRSRPRPSDASQVPAALAERPQQQPAH